MNEKAAAAGKGPTTSKSERRMSSRYLRLNRLPTLQEVLDRRTRPPLDLFCFYVSYVPAMKITWNECTDGLQIFLQRESAEDALDFWLDVQQHENMCKAYFKVGCRFKLDSLTLRRISDDQAVLYRKNGLSSPLLHVPMDPISRPSCPFRLIQIVMTRRTLRQI